MPKKNITKKEKKIVDDLWEYTKQANMQSDNMEMSSDGIQNTGDFSYSFRDLGDMGQLDLFDEMDMRDKYPALSQAWEHYQSVLEVCKTKEKEDAD
jgi:hypothetical protein|tara:strand:- start:220 stop:507 length:288 start_codon:yes stop_codon:yes gene_type:complete